MATKKREKKSRIVARFLSYVALRTQQRVLTKMIYRLALNSPKSRYLKIDPYLKINGLVIEARMLLQHGNNFEYRKFFGMNKLEFKTLSMKLTPKLLSTSKEEMPPGMSPEAKLACTLNYLRSGSSFTVLAIWWSISSQHLDFVVKQVCQALCDLLSVEADCRPKSLEDWLKIADEFDSRWRLPHCLGAVDGKQVKVVKHPRSGCLLHNYKDESIILLAVVDAKYRFIHFNVGASDSRSVWAEDRLGSALNKGHLDSFIPAPNYLPRDEKRSCGLVNYFFVGDDAFGLQPHMMKPFRVRNGMKDKDLMDNTNYRLSSARKVVECGFGHLARNFRVFDVLHTRKEMTSLVVRTCVHIHNFLRLSREDEEKEIRQIMKPAKRNFESIFLPPRPFSRPLLVEKAEVNRYRLHLYFNSVDIVKRKKKRRSRK
ncbi:uncharacterized protein LOC134818332 [Bolinopsis microptera]|uniref:uncharacterized protein LOC134818332 n=1 Tax=Bolinopsis microptera TaxID=2820187 RepID=UPI00307A50E7